VKRTFEVRFAGPAEKRLAFTWPIIASISSWLVGWETRMSDGFAGYRYSGFLVGNAPAGCVNGCLATAPGSFSNRLWPSSKQWQVGRAAAGRGGGKTVAREGTGWRWPRGCPEKEIQVTRAAEETTEDRGYEFINRKRHRSDGPAGSK
jgi:hypothetical protein